MLDSTLRDLCSWGRARNEWGRKEGEGEVQDCVSESTAHPGSVIHQEDLDSTYCHEHAYNLLVKNTEQNYQKENYQKKKVYG